MNKQAKPQPPFFDVALIKSNEKDRMRKKMLYLGYQMGYDRPRTEEQRGLSPSEICVQNVSAWCESMRCSVQRPLNHMTHRELRNALTQFTKVYQSFIKQLRKA